MSGKLRVLYYLYTICLIILVRIYSYKINQDENQQIMIDIVFPRLQFYKEIYKYLITIHVVNSLLLNV